MTEWAYRANEKRRNLQDTRQLADEYGILARSAHRKDRKPVPLARKVEVGDILHFYYRPKKGARLDVGSYRVLPPDEARFPSALPGTALVRIAKVPENEALLRFMETAPNNDEGTGYRKDPDLGVFTGFRIERLPDVQPPNFEEWLFPQRGTLTRKRAKVPATEALLSRITHDPGVMAGKACFRGMRVTVGTILSLLAAGRTEQEVLAEYPYLDAMDLRAALAYAAYRLEEWEIPLQAA